MKHLEQIERLNNLVEFALENGLYDAARALRMKERGVIYGYAASQGVVRSVRSIKCESGSVQR